VGAKKVVVGQGEQLVAPPGWYVLNAHSVHMLDASWMP
jgi:hypothetical protein